MTWRVVTISRQICSDEHFLQKVEAVTPLDKLPPPSARPSVGGWGPTCSRPKSPRGMRIPHGGHLHHVGTHKSGVIYIYIYIYIYISNTSINKCLTRGSVFHTTQKILKLVTCDKASGSVICDAGGCHPERLMQCSATSGTCSGYCSTSVQISCGPKSITKVQGGMIFHWKHLKTSEPPNLFEHPKRYSIPQNHTTPHGGPPWRANPALACPQHWSPRRGSPNSWRTLRDAPGRWELGSVRRWIQGLGCQRCQGCEVQMLGVALRQTNCNKTGSDHILFWGTSVSCWCLRNIWGLELNHPVRLKQSSTSGLRDALLDGVSVSLSQQSAVAQIWQCFNAEPGALWVHLPNFNPRCSNFASGSCIFLLLVIAWNWSEMFILALCWSHDPLGVVRGSRPALIHDSGGVNMSQLFWDSQGSVVLQILSMYIPPMKITDHGYQNLYQWGELTILHGTMYWVTHSDRHQLLVHRNR